MKSEQLRDFCKCVMGLLNSFLFNFPGGPVVENLPVNAGITGWIPGMEDPTCLGVTKPRAKTTEPVPGSHNHQAQAPQGLCCAIKEATTTKSPSTAREEQPPTRYDERKAHAARKTQHSQN